MRTANKLSAMAVSKMSKPGCYADGLGLYLQVSTSGTKAWLFRFMRQGRARKMGLGPIHTVSLAEARDEALACRKMLREGIDPIAARKARLAAVRVAEARGVTFRHCAERYIGAHRAGWRNEKHAAQWGTTLATYVYPVIGELPVSAIDVGLVLQVLEPIWTAKPETAGRVRGRVETILDWATARGYRSAENPARWRGHLQNLLPALSKVARVKHHPALPYADVPAFMQQLRALEDLPNRALEIAILTATRTGEVLGTRWDEISRDGRMWIIPAERMKAAREHRVPLPDRAVEILDTLPREGEFVFPGARAGKPLGERALLNALQKMGRVDITVHGFRSSFRDWAAEQTAYPSELCEMALGHIVSDRVEAAYRRGDMLEKRRRLMADWASFCAAPARTGEVVPMRGAR